MGLNRYETSLKTWIEAEKDALDFVNLTGKLFLDRSVELILFRSQLIDRSASVVLYKHSYATNVVGYPLDISDSLMLAKAIEATNITSARLDIGTLNKEWIEEKANYEDVNAFIADKLKDGIGKDPVFETPRDVVLFGFGRISYACCGPPISWNGKVVNFDFDT